MPDWICTLAALAAVALMIGLAVRSLWKTHKRKQAGGGCCGCCADCGLCRRETEKTQNHPDPGAKKANSGVICNTRQ